MSEPLLQSPAVSVLMPVHNAERWLREALDSVLWQSLGCIELIAVDDGSTDGSVAMLESAARADGRVRLLRQPHQGLIAALNLGLVEARAPLLARLDADDIAHPTRLQQQAAFLAEHPEVGVVGAWALEIDAGGHVRGRRTPEVAPAALKQVLARNNPIIHSAVMARTDLLRQLGGYRAAFQTAEDYDLWLRASEVAQIANLPAFLVSYRVHGAGASRRDPLRQAFSARLTRRSAMARRERGVDPADRLDGPPDWRVEAAADTFYAEDAGLYRWLDGASTASDPIARAGAQRLMDGVFELDHQERRLAAQAIWRRVRGADRNEAASARGLLVSLLRQRPTTVLKAAWSLRA
jgi:glycosyltransferase involved in cell wall biosynthesis